MMIDDMSYDHYLALDRASSHRLYEILRSPLKMRHNIMHRQPSSRSMKLGTAFHSLIANDKSNIAVQPKTANKRSNENKSNLVQFLAEVTGHEAPRPPASCSTKSSKLDHQIQALDAILEQSSIEICTEEEMEKAEEMHDQLMRKPLAHALFDAGRAEVTCLQIDPDTDVEMKSRFDWLPDKYDAIVDIKTTKDVSHAGFRNDCVRYGYPLQMAFYQFMYNLETDLLYPVFIVAVETEPPFDSVIYEVDDMMLEFGESQYLRALEIYAECSRTGIWPGYDWDWNKKEHAIQTLTLPKWAYDV